jgi:hypothetical protein
MKPFLSKNKTPEEKKKRELKLKLKRKKDELFRKRKRTRIITFHEHQTEKEIDQKYHPVQDDVLKIFEQFQNEYKYESKEKEFNLKVLFEDYKNESHENILKKLNFFIEKENFILEIFTYLLNEMKNHKKSKIDFTTIQFWELFHGIIKSDRKIKINFEVDSLLGVMKKILTISNRKNIQEVDNFINETLKFIFLKNNFYYYKFEKISIIDIIDEITKKKKKDVNLELLDTFFQILLLYINQNKNQISLSSTDIQKLLHISTFNGEHDKYIKKIFSELIFSNLDVNQLYEEKSFTFEKNQYIISGDNKFFNSFFDAMYLTLKSSPTSMIKYSLYFVQEFYTKINDRNHMCSLNKNNGSPNSNHLDFTINLIYLVISGFKEFEFDLQIISEILLNIFNFMKECNMYTLTLEKLYYKELKEIFYFLKANVVFQPNIEKNKFLLETISTMCIIDYRPILKFMKYFWTILFVSNKQFINSVPIKNFISNMFDIYTNIRIFDKFLIHQMESFFLFNDRSKFNKYDDKDVFEEEDDEIIYSDDNYNLEVDKSINLEIIKMDEYISKFNVIVKDLPISQIYLILNNYKNNLGKIFENLETNINKIIIFISNMINFANNIVITEINSEKLFYISNEILNGVRIIFKL